MDKANSDVRKLARDSGIRLWQIAGALGVSDATFSRLLRRPLLPRDRERVVAAINELAVLKICTDALVADQDSRTPSDPIGAAYTQGVEVMRAAALREIAKLEKSCVKAHKEAYVSARWAVKHAKIF